MKVGDLVFSNGQIAIIVDKFNFAYPRGDKGHVRLYYFRSGNFGNSHLWGVVPI